MRRAPLSAPIISGIGAQGLASRRQVHRAPTVPIVTPGVARTPTQDQHIASTPCVQYSLGQVHGELAHRLDLGVGRGAAQRQSEVGRPTVEPRRLVLPGDVVPVEPSRPSLFAMARQAGPDVKRGVPECGAAQVARGDDLRPPKPCAVASTPLNAGCAPKADRNGCRARNGIMREKRTRPRRRGGTMPEMRHPDRTTTGHRRNPYPVASMGHHTGR